MCIRFEDGETYLADCEIIGDGHGFRFEQSTVGLERGIKETRGFRRQSQVVLFNLTIERAGYCVFNARRPALLKIGSFSIFKTKEKERSTAVLTTAPFPQRPPFSFSLCLPLPPSLDRTSNRFDRRRISLRCFCSH